MSSNEAARDRVSAEECSIIFLNSLKILFLLFLYRIYRSTLTFEVVRSLSFFSLNIALISFSFPGQTFWMGMDIIICVVGDGPFPPFFLFLSTFFCLSVSLSLCLSVSLSALSDFPLQLFMAVAVLYFQAASFFGPENRRQSLFHSGGGPGRDEALANATDPSLTEGAVARVESMERLRFVCGLRKSALSIYFVFLGCSSLFLTTNNLFYIVISQLR